MSTDWPSLCEAGARIVVDEMRSSDDDAGGLRSYQREVTLHLLRHLASYPGMIAAERTGLGKSLIATSLVASLAQAHARTGQGPFRVGLLAPSGQVLSNWWDKLLPDALGRSDGKIQNQPTYLWRDEGAAPTWDISGQGCEAPERRNLVIYASHYGRGITNRFPEWSRTKAGRHQQAREVLGGTTPAPLHVLIIDEAHQLKNEGVARAAAIKALFGESGCPIPVERIVLLTATPFQLQAAQELYRLMRLLSYPHTNGGPELPPVARPYTLIRLHELFDRYRVEVARWLDLRMREGGDEAAGSSLEKKARASKEEIETLLRAIMVRTHAPPEHVQIRYGRPRPSDDNRLPDASRGLPVEDPLERLLFLAWDGAIAARTTFVAAEQQTLTSSAAALRARQETEIAPSAAERFRKPMAPASVQQALLDLSAQTAELVDPDHAKVLATVEAVVGRGKGRSHLPRPTVVFAERSETLKQLHERIRTDAPDVEVDIVSGDTGQQDRDHLLDRFNGRAGRRERRLDVLLASKVAEMGLDVDGPADKEDIWLIHHDFPWNPAMVDQRNGRVCRPAKRGANEKPAPVFVTYPFLRDTVDERIFKRMLMRQALAELLLGTDDVARALRLGDHESLEGLSLDRVTPEELRRLTPDLSPRCDTRPSAMQQLEGEPPRQPEPVPPDDAPRGIDASPVGRARPVWCPVELLDAADRRAAGPLLDDSVIAETVSRAIDELNVVRFDSGALTCLQVDVTGRQQAVALLLRKGASPMLEVLSLADTDVGSDEKWREALKFNARLSAAGLVLVGDTDAERLVARAANPTATLQLIELERMILDTAKLADDWEAHFYGSVDRW